MPRKNTEVQSNNTIKKVKVLHFVPGFDLGGIESRLLDWYRNIDREKIQFDVLIFTDLNNVLIKEIRELGGNVDKINALGPKTVLLFFKDIYNFFKENRDYDVVHSHSLPSGYFV